MEGFIRDDNVIAMRRKLCNNCASKWDELLEGKIKMFSLCDDCKEKVEAAEVIDAKPNETTIAEDMRALIKRMKNEGVPVSYEMKNMACALTLTQILDEVKEDICKNYCKYAKECAERMEAGEELRECPLDRL